MDKTTPSNEETIAGLTKDLEEMAVKASGNESADDNTSRSMSEQTNSSKGEAIESDSHFDESSEKSEETDNDDVVTDEEYLKELETELDEETKLQRKEHAQKLKEQGNEEFKDKRYKEAIHTYSQALHVCPVAFAKERSVLYSNRAAARVKLEQSEEAIKDCTKALDLNPNYVKAQLRRAQLYKATDKLDEALADYQRVLELDSNILEARQACMTLPEEIKERNEKLKAEMMGKLKDLGNMILKPFGLSTENFKVVQDPSSGGYSVSFQGNATK